MRMRRCSAMPPCPVTNQNHQNRHTSSFRQAAAAVVFLSFLSALPSLPPSFHPSLFRHTSRPRHFFRRPLERLSTPTTATAAAAAAAAAAGPRPTPKPLRLRRFRRRRCRQSLAQRGRVTKGRGREGTGRESSIPSHHPSNDDPQSSVFRRDGAAPPPHPLAGTGYSQ